MGRIRVIVGTTAVVAASALLLPITTLAQATKAGVVTTLQGSATVARSTAPQPSPLKFRDDVFVEDRIVTGESSTVRILLGGKAVITVRERSTLTISETATTATVAVDAGKIALAVAKDRMKPGESVEIKTPNAVAGVRGTVVIAEVSGSSGAVNSRFTLLTGIVDVTMLDQQTGRPSGPAVTLRPLQGIGVTSRLGSVRAVSRGEAQAIASDYKVSVPTPPPAANTQVMERQVDQAVQHTATLTGGSHGAGQGGTKDRSGDEGKTATAADTTSDDGKRTTGTERDDKSATSKDSQESGASGSTAPTTSTRTLDDDSRGRRDRDDDSRGGRRGNDDRASSGGGRNTGGGPTGGGNPLGGGNSVGGGNAPGGGSSNGPVIGAGLLGNNRNTGGGIPRLGGDDLRPKNKGGSKKNRD